jgi:phosphopantothenoylcysteine decarboxylase / phosphopantothenate---cysteine ligase
MSETLPQTLAGRRVLLGVTGGIAAYKAAELARRLAEIGAEVQVVMTAHATEFIAPLTFQALTGREVRTGLFDPKAEMAMGHIELARWADVVVVAPASANFLQRLARGAADDLLTTLCLATDRPLAVAPSMNRLMWASKATQANVHQLHGRGVHILGPGSGFQACGETGAGRMWEPEQIRDALIELLSHGPLAGRHVVLTAGPTQEPIDPVRVLTNRSSGKMGYALAQALAALGARVTLVSGPTRLPVPRGVQRVEVETAADMLKAALEAARDADLFIGAAAVADYTPAQVAPQKIKKKTDTLSLTLNKTADILQAVRAAHPKLFMVGFAAETEQLATHAKGKLEKKKLQMVAANRVGGGRAFDRDDNELLVLWRGGQRKLALQAKSELARELAALIAARYSGRK